MVILTVYGHYQHLTTTFGLEASMSESVRVHATCERGCKSI